MNYEDTIGCLPAQKSWPDPAKIKAEYYPELAGKSPSADIIQPHIKIIETPALVFLYLAHI